MKTLFLYIDDDNVFFFEKEGNFSHLHEVIINCSDEEKNVEELMDILNNLISHDKKLSYPTKDWDYFVRVGWEW
jgi:hypothetical protein